SRNVWNGEYHSRSQCVCGTIDTLRFAGRPARTLSVGIGSSLPQSSGRLGPVAAGLRALNLRAGTGREAERAVCSTAAPETTATAAVVARAGRPVWRLPS